MPIPAEYYYLDRCDDVNGTTLRSHIPDIGSFWTLPGFGRAEIQDGKIVVTSGFINMQYEAGGDTPADAKYCEQGYLVEILIPTTDSFICGDVINLSGWRFSWRPKTSPSSDFGTIELSGHGVTANASVPAITGGVHHVKIIGQKDTLTAFVGPFGVRITGITSFQEYAEIGLQMSANYAVQLVYGKNGTTPDYEVLFLSDFGAVGAFSGSSGGGGGEGGVPNTGGSNPENVPCDPSTTLVINNGAAVAVAPTDPCMWTGLIWWKLVCEAVLTEADYAVEAEVFFNTLTDPFMSVGVIARLNEATGGHYFAALWREEIVIGKKPSAAADDVIFATKPLTLKAGTWYTIRLEIEGFTLRAYLNDELQLTTTDPNASFGGPGCAGVRLSRGNPATDIRIDNFRVWLNVKRPGFAEAPVFLDSLVVTKDDGMDVEASIVVADSLVASETITMLVPKTVHINEGVVFTDRAGQVKRIQEFLLGLDSMDLGIGINVQDVLTAAEKLGLRMNIPVTDIISFTDEERTIHGVSDTVTIAEFIAQFLEGGVPDRVGASDSVRVVKTSVAAYAPPELTFYARDLKRLRMVETGKKVR